MVVITSNSEKELPDAFLRRCVFHYIEFPDEAMMKKIVKVHFPTIESNLLQAALKKFFAIRSNNRLKKPPSTSELIDWLHALIAMGMNPAALEKETPLMGVLLKKEEDISGRSLSFPQ